MYTYTDGQAQGVKMDMGNPQPQRDIQPNSHTCTETKQAQKHNRHRETAGTQAKRHTATETHSHTGTET